MHRQRSPIQITRIYRPDAGAVNAAYDVLIEHAAQRAPQREAQIGGAMSPMPFAANGSEPSGPGAATVNRVGDRGVAVAAAGVKP